MKITLHAGTHKTGTTSFQAALRRNAGRLREAGIAVLVTPPQAHAGHPGKFDPAWLRGRADAARKDGMERLVLSHEVISTFSAEELSRLLDALGPGEIRYVAAFRHWVSFLPSRWKQSCRRRDGQSFQRFLARLDAMAPEHHPFDFAAVPARARAAGIADLHLLSWEGDGAGPDGLLGPLWRACGLPETGMTPEPRGLARLVLGQGGANRSEGEGIEDRIRLFNALRARREGLPEDGLFDVLCKTGPDPVFFDQADTVARVLTGNAALRRELDGLLEPRTETVTLVPDRFAALAARLDAESRPFTGRDRFFDAIPARSLRAAALEGDDMPEALAHRMEQALAQAAQTQTTRWIWRRRLIGLRDRMLRR